MQTKLCECGCGREFQVFPKSRRKYFSKECYIKSVQGVCIWKKDEIICGDDGQKRDSEESIFNYYATRPEAFRIDWELEPTEENIKSIAWECVNTDPADIEREKEYEW